MLKNNIKKSNIETLIITGGNKGIGQAISKIFLENNWLVVSGSRTMSKFKNKNFKHLKMDVRFEKEHLNLFNYANKFSNNIKCFINCAGFSKWSPIEKISQRSWNEMIDVNLKGYFWGCKVASKKLKKDTSIINISSLAGKRGSANNSLYCITKFGITALTQSLSKELGPKGIRVNSVCPVYIPTQGLIGALKGKYSPSKKQNINKYFSKFTDLNSALGRLPNSIEIAQTCYFLASNYSSAITGQNINVDCGVLPQ
jgi:3-oxoacyl-[acyl-carrier protein] reductase/meso-butanediol dehydrogenase/(S,S)-butanediol dehydrogenase/diacetyl reductase